MHMQCNRLVVEPEKLTPGVLHTWIRLNIIRTLVSWTVFKHFQYIAPQIYSET